MVFVARILFFLKLRVLISVSWILAVQIGEILEVLCMRQYITMKLVTCVLRN